MLIFKKYCFFDCTRDNQSWGLCGKICKRKIVEEWDINKALKKSSIFKY